MLTLKWKQGTAILTVWHNDTERSIPCSCIVRNDVNGWRLDNQVVTSIPDSEPYQPRVFPVGQWEIFEPIEKRDKYTAPYFIPTDAFQMLPVWEVKNGRYVRETKKLIRDEGYGLHFSESNTTLGCIKITNLEDLLWLVDEINYMLYNGIRPIFIVEA